MYVDSRVIRLPDVCRRVGLSRSQVYRLEAAGNFPRRLKIGSRASAWLEHEIAGWISERADAREPSGDKQS